MSTDWHEIDQVTIVKTNGLTFVYNGVPRPGNLIAAHAPSLTASGLATDPWGNSFNGGTWIGPDAMMWLARYGMTELTR
jgi:hypothetical protein